MNKTKLLISGLIYIGLIIIFIVIAFTKHSGGLLKDNEYLVTKVIDGDTIEVLKDGSKFRVRYLGINTPEITHTDKPNDCYALEAKKFNENFVLNKYVKLYKDTLDTDKYGRLLRYVYTNGENVNLKFLELGAAKSLIIPPNNNYSRKIIELENTAKLKKLGLWGLCY